MKKYILTFVIALLSLYTQAQQMPLPAPNEPNVLFLKYSKVLNGTNEKGRVYVKKDSENMEFRKAYAFFSNDATGKVMDYTFYAPNQEYCGYTELATYNNVAINKEQLKALLEPHPYYLRTQQIRNYSKIYLIDLDSPQPKQPNKYKIIEVRLYFAGEHD
ncbi:MAG: hypothetical protein MUC49_16055 [Raineya sp.]|jgi:hypothetical protein|nr:hypothetical protein [Raineya sp.]